MSNVKQAMDTYLNGLRNQHAVETQAIGTIQNELPRMKAYPDLHSKMETNHERSFTQAARPDNLLEKHGSKKSLLKEAVTGAVPTLAGSAHAGPGEEFVKTALAQT
ncbi:ferritin-like domain-containing protein, partial [Methylobacterium sp. J-088]|uniref:DUF892 family protein n=1 Tax=Methylobacterium sp. J-088 TaxID=2836664 RepID=UPI001FBBFB41